MGRKLKIEIAKSNASLCRACGKAIPKGNLRIGSGGHWFDMKCAADRELVTPESLDRLVGFDRLNDWQVEHARNVVKSGAGS